MRPITREWLAKAEEDFTVAGTLLRRKKIPADIVCFHSQQAAEKYLKAVLQENVIRFGKTHGLLVLLEALSNAAKGLAQLVDDLRILDQYGLDVLYPGRDSTVKQARDAVFAMRRVRAAVLPMLK